MELVGVGGAVSELKEEERGAGMSAFYARLAWDIGLFIHRNGSLLASIHVSESWTQRFRCNIFPGVIRWRHVSPSVYLGVRDSDVIVGLNVAGFPIGVAASH